MGKVYDDKGDFDHAVGSFRKASEVYDAAQLKDKHLIVSSLLRDMADVKVKIWHAVRAPIQLNRSRIMKSINLR